MPEIETAEINSETKKQIIKKVLTFANAHIDNKDIYYFCLDILDVFRKTGKKRDTTKPEPKEDQAKSRRTRMREPLVHPDPVIHVNPEDQFIESGEAAFDKAKENRDESFLLRMIHVAGFFKDAYHIYEIAKLSADASVVAKALQVLAHFKNSEYIFWLMKDSPYLNLDNALQELENIKDYNLIVTSVNEVPNIDVEKCMQAIERFAQSGSAKAANLAAKMISFGNPKVDIQRMLKIVRSIGTGIDAYIAARSELVDKNQCLDIIEEKKDYAAAMLMARIKGVDIERIQRFVSNSNDDRYTPDKVARASFALV